MTTHENTPTDRPEGPPEPRPTSSPASDPTDDTTSLFEQGRGPAVTDTHTLHGQGSTSTDTHTLHGQGSTSTTETRTPYSQESLNEPAPPVWSAATAPAPRPRGPRSGTLILGLVLTVCGVAAILVALGFRIDLQLALIGLLVLAALTLLLTPLLRKRPSGLTEGAGRAS
ncbi:hypothetical protein FE374_15365 [Georgenia yuyongxinii]|uniref:Uncharacterized protein n=1 Tax=Georgenia yuyongxinii TaxID=2589797 RepID=A0A5B8C5Z7_9MICO|nr:hypothetical protein [Georgenia yuyongxinii]QDC25808.1 hypothetical protein FE374_15365 [Georgenia yuyongxinii]